MRGTNTDELVTRFVISFVLLVVAHVVEPGVIGSRSSTSPHRKQSQPLTSQNDLSEQEAMNFLKDYGYIGAVPSARSAFGTDGKSRSRDQSTPQSTQSTDDFKLDDIDLEDGIKDFQRRYHLPVTGQIDEATKEVMSKPRCGVPDYQVPFTQSDDLKSQELFDVDSKRLGAKDKSDDETSPVMVTEGDISFTNSALDGKQSAKSLLDPRSESAKLGMGAKLPLRPPFEPPMPGGKALADDGVWGQSIVEVSSVDDLDDAEMVDEDDDEIYTEAATNLQEEVINATTMVTYTVTEVLSTLVSELDSRTPTSTPTIDDDDKDKDKKQGERPRRDVRELVRQIMSGSGHRQRRDSQSGGQSSTSSGSGLRFSANDLPITWRVLDAYPSQYIADTSNIFAAAFRRWAEVTPLTFREQTSGDVLNVDIYIAFCSSNDLSDFGDYRWSPGQLALSDVSSRHIFFNDNKLWTDRSDQDYNLQSVAAHEIGHFLGLGHSTSASSIMYPIYRSFEGKVIIDDETKTAVQNIYGTCNNSLDTVFDWMRLSSSNQWTYTTYFVRNRWNWVYVNSRNEVKYAEPKLLGARFNGVPNDLDAVVQNVDKPRDEMYFFKGNKYWRFNHASKSVYTTTVDGVSWSANGRLISEGWPAKPGSNTRIPDNIDAAYYDKRDNNYYFFKGSKVYAYDMEEGGCCLDNYPMDISDAYPGEFSYISSLPNNIDAAYYSIKHKKLFFFKGAYYWEHATFDPSATTVYNKVKDRAPWDTRWRDICEVE